MSVSIYSDQSRTVNWYLREKTDSTLTINVLSSSVAFDISTYTFIADIFKVGVTSPILTLTQGSGITNGGATGILTLALTDTQLTINPDQYFWKLRTTAPTDELWFNGQFVVNGYIWDGGSNYDVTANITLGGNNLSLSLVLGGGGSTNTRVISTTSTATLTPNVDLYDMAVITAQAAALTIAAPTGTPSNGNAFVFRITDNGTARALTFNAIYRAIGSALPTTTTISKTIYFVAVYNSTAIKWDVFPSNLEV